MAPSSDIQAFRDVLGSAKSVAIVAGAGLSAGSGIPTYRGSGGLWTKQDPQKYATLDGFKQDAGAIWQFYHARRAKCLKAQPNAAHRALASLSLPAARKRPLPALRPDQPPLYVTQNFDSLSPRALEAVSEQLTPDEFKTAQDRLIEMHGSAFRTICTQCKHVNFSYVSPLCPALAHAHAEAEESELQREIPIEDLPRCGGPEWNGSNRYARCGGLLRPGIVWFGEVPEGMGDIARALNWTDILIVVGTSSLVHPAAGFAKMVKNRGGKVAIFNLNQSKGDDDADFLFLGPCEETLLHALGLSDAA
ncbi:NAD-dependent protein [Sparassis crispa]|uniref:NAD-dependent protein n=1 Tax=Sparassis crispa TaxID=139825 RepID=A0A401G9K3_9APHY|nr:NAD-dependent protein [Sparassis crispa]GBE78854.1 NAD-dependent protein [Sparassis crispa]